MVYVISIGKVKNYDEWLPTFAEDGPLLKANGGVSARALQCLDDPNLIVVISEWENMNDAKKFAESDELRARMQVGGVIGKPEIYFLEEKLVLF